MDRQRLLWGAIFSERGLGAVGALLLLAIVGAIVFVGYKALPFFYCEQEIVGMMESQAQKATIFSDVEMQRNIMQRVKELEIPADADDLHINRFNGKIIIEMKYQEVLYIEIGKKTYDLYIFDFHPRVERPL